jgi:glycosyltransferase involved in cell wall biosynthesis
MSTAAGVRKAVRTMRTEGLDGVVDRLTRSAVRRFGVEVEPLLLRASDVVDSQHLPTPPAGPTPPRGSGLDIGWVLTPPAAGSGGHTTIFRLVEALEAAGHRCVLYLYDTGTGSLAEREQVIRRWWPRVRAEVRDVADGLPDMDAWVATAWQTAHVLARRGDVRGRRFYLAQDFEPYFYGRGSAYELAEDSYRFGFRMLTVGHMVADELQEHLGLTSTVLPFGCDQDVYRVTNEGARNEVVFYARPGTPRRGFELAVMALEEFSRRRPDVVINTFGVAARRLPFPAVVHSGLHPTELNELYNRCAAGLAMSFTNISLIAYELLAAGVVPVVNDWRGSRADLDNPFVAWSRPTPGALADALVQSVDRAPDVSAQRVTRSVRDVTWGVAHRTVVSAIEAACYDAEISTDPEISADPEFEKVGDA